MQHQLHMHLLSPDAGDLTSSEYSQAEDNCMHKYNIHEGIDHEAHVT